MFQTKRLPVTVISSDDAGAPALEAKFGSLTTLLKKCLVDGVNGKSLGWEVAFEDSHDAVFRSKAADGNRCFLRVKNGEHQRHALIDPFKNMDSLESGSDWFGYRNNYNRFGYMDSNGKAPKWTVIGHAKAFVLVLSPNNEKSVMLFFGDFASLAAADTGNTAFLHNSYNSEYLYVSSLKTAADSGNTTHLPQRYNGVVQRTVCELSGLCYQFRGTAYPDPVVQGLTASEIWLEELNENDQALTTRGLLPGVFKVKQDLRSFQEGAVFSMAGSADQWLKFTFANSYLHQNAYLINATAWEG